jgi:hypothetical protein
MKSEDKFDFKELASSLVIVIPFWIVAIVLWRSTGDIFYLFNFLYIGAAIGVGIGVYSALPRKKKPLGRKLTLFLIGGYLLVFLGLLKFENLQIEGFFFYLLAGFFSGSVIHYMVAKIFGPILFNRAWCSWACWTAMILDLLPYKRSSGRIPGKWGWLALHTFHFKPQYCASALVWIWIPWSITPPCRKGLETRLGRDGLVWAIDNKPLNLQVVPEGSCSRFYVHCANKIGI